MRILLTSGASYAPPKGGSTRSNLVWLRLLVAGGHTCRVICSAADESGETEQDGILILRVPELALHAELLASEIRRFAPDWVLVSSEDVSQRLLRAAAGAAFGKIVYLAHTPQFFPFGPESWNPDAEATQIVERAAGVVAIGTHMAGYVERYSLAKATVIHPPIYARKYGERTTITAGRSILIINPCVVKGIEIFLALAERFPQYSFIALAGWGTTADDMAAMAQAANIRVLRGVRDIEEVLCQARVLLMPSLWYEGFGLIAMEAMLRGIPVISSDSGGLLEAKAGTGYVIPVRPIKRYEQVFDENNMPRPVRAQQDIEAWVAPLRELMTNRQAYVAEVERSQEAARRFLGGVHPERFGDYLLGLPRRSGAALRILLGHNSTYYPSQGGGDISNRLLMEALASRGHVVRVVTKVAQFGNDTFWREMAKRGMAHEDGRFTLNGVDVYTLTRDRNIRGYFMRQIAEFDPDVILLSTDDPGQLLLEPALEAHRAKVVYMARATIALPFGPDGSGNSPSKTKRLREVDAVVGVSEYVAQYIREHGGMQAVHVPISLMEPGIPEKLGNFENAYVTMVNPCAMKGISIFLQMADGMPDVQFAAVPSWGTSDEDLAALQARRNISLLDHADNIDAIFRWTRVLLVPSLWAEARSRVVMEAMLRGIPVLAADGGGLPEAKLGVPYLLPVNAITNYQPGVDARMIPIADVPEQDAGPWMATLGELLGNRHCFEENARRSRAAALEYLERLTVESFEKLLRETFRRERSIATKAISPDRQRLVALRMESRRWFPRCDSRVFAFPFAGAGTLWCRDWKMCPALLPGREGRLLEKPLTTMGAVVAALVPAIAPLLDRPYILFGHSMGAGIAFELAHSLIQSGRRTPSALIVSATKAPRLREVIAEPTEDELIGQLERLGGLPAGTARNRDWMQHVFPALRADTQLYRQYAPTRRDPLDIPIFAYCGDADPNISIADMEAWGEQTSQEFKLRVFPGGHFYFQPDAGEMLASMEEDRALYQTHETLRG